jgi:hypothetical protein
MLDDAYRGTSVPFFIDAAILFGFALDVYLVARRRVVKLQAGYIL